MWIPLRWTPESLDHIAAHGLARREVDAALSGRLYKRRSGDQLILIGRTENRYLFIVLRPCPDSPRCAEVATARPTTAAEKRLFASRGKTFR